MDNIGKLWRGKFIHQLSTLCCQYSPQVAVVLGDAQVRVLEFGDLAAGVQDCGVIPAAEVGTDFRQAMVGQLLGQGHRDLAGPGDGACAARGVQVGDPEIGSAS